MLFYLKISIDWDSIEDIFTDIDWNDDLKELDSDINQKNSDKNSVSKDVVEKVDLKSKENIEEKANKSDDNNESDMNLKGNYDTKICDLGPVFKTNGKEAVLVFKITESNWFSCKAYA